mgnify:CR=1 FL=1
MKKKDLKDFVRGEFIGTAVKIVDSKNPSQKGITGKVVDETRQMIIIKTDKGVKNFAKDQCIFSFQLPSGEWIRVNGKLLVARPEDRVKKKFRKW